MSHPVVSLLLLPPEPHTAGAPTPGAAGTRHSFDLQGDGPWELVEPGAAGAVGAPGADPGPSPLDRPLATADAYRDLVPEMLDRARGDLIGVVHAGDQLEPGALASILAYLAELGRGPDDLPAALYTDEQWPGPGASGIAAKPDFSIRHLRQYDAIGRLFLVRRDVLAAAGGSAPGDHARDAAAAWDLRLRIAEETADIVHVPVLGIWRSGPPPAGDAYLEAGRHAVEAHLARLGVDADVEPTRAAPGDAAGFLRIWPRIPGRPHEAPLVSLVVPTGGGRREVRGVDTLLVAHTVASVVDRTTYPNYEIVLVPSDGTDPSAIDACRAAVARAGAPAQVRVAPADGPFNFSGSVNAGVAAAGGQYVVLLNDDVEVLEPRWLERMVAVAQDSQVGAVGAKLLFEDGTIQHVGVYVKNDGWVGHQHIFEPDITGAAGPQGAKVVDLDVLAVTGACLLVRRDSYERVGGFTESLPLNFNDVDFCLKLVAAGYVNVVTPFARLHHFESSTRTAQVHDEETAALDWWVPRSLGDPNVHVRGVH